MPRHAMTRIGKPVPRKVIVRVKSNGKIVDRVAKRDGFTKLDHMWTGTVHRDGKIVRGIIYETGCPDLYGFVSNGG